jgi:hypothetical protein
MITMRRQLLGLGIVAASSLLALQAANAMSGPTAIQIDGGPLGPLQLSGGADGYLYFVNPVTNGEDTGANVANALIELQKTDGELQFTIEVGSNGGAIGLGSGGRPGQTSVTTFATGPLYAGYLTVAPTGTPFTISAGQIGSLEGYESGIDWNNPSQIVTDIFEVQNSQSRGVSGNYTQGPLSVTVTFGDGFDTGVWNFIQGLATYTINSTNTATLYVAGNLGRTGNAARIYGGGSVGAYGTYYVNSDMVGGYYSYTMGNLSLVPEAQFVEAKPDAAIGIMHQTWNAGAALFADYSLSSTSPYSVGGWVEYFDSHTSPADQANWFAGPNSEGVGFAVSPTWQYKDLFARVNAGYLYLLRNTTAGTKYGYGPSGTGRNTVDASLEGGLLF